MERENKAVKAEKLYQSSDFHIKQKDPVSGLGRYCSACHTGMRDTLNSKILEHLSGDDGLFRLIFAGAVSYDHVKGHPVNVWPVPAGCLF